MSIAYGRKRRYPFHQRSGELVREKRYDETFIDAVEFADLLESSETISSVEVDTSGPTITGEAIATGITASSKVTFTITATGSATFKITTSAGRVYERKVRWVPVISELGDYR